MCPLTTDRQAATVADALVAADLDFSFDVLLNLSPEVTFDLRQLVYKDLQLTGATITPPGTMARLVKLIERGRLRPMLARTFPLRELAKAQEVFMAKRHVGNIVVTME